MIALLATGDELIEGDVINTNGPFIAHELSQQQLALGKRMTCRDVETDIEACLAHLLSEHDCVIITGGLGPTSDDRTREGLARFVQRELVFDAASWESIRARLKRYQLNVNAANRQQAYFPSGAEIYPNAFGTANGCKVQHQNKTLYMLPGPPNECKPMFEQYVLKDILRTAPKLPYTRLRWLLFGVSEGEIAAKLDAVTSRFQCRTGYRWFYPYIEFKVDVHQDEAVDTVRQTLEALLQPHQLLIGASQPASDKLKFYLQQSPAHTLVRIDDQATGGLLQSLIHDPSTHHCLQFSSQPKPAFKDNLATTATESTAATDHKGLSVQIRGLHAYWNPAQNEATIAPSADNRLSVHFIDQAGKTVIERSLALKPTRIALQAAELVCALIYLRLTETKAA